VCLIFSYEDSPEKPEEKPAEKTEEDSKSSDLKKHK
jgi:hypothetical protein